jgi:hypothetical protein
MGYTGPDIWTGDVAPGACSTTSVDTHGQWAEVDLMGIDNVTKQPFIVNVTFGAVSGLGLGVNGTAADHSHSEW